MTGADIHLFMTRDGEWRARIKIDGDYMYTAKHHVVSLVLGNAAHMINLAVLRSRSGGADD